MRKDSEKWLYYEKKYDLRIMIQNNMRKENTVVKRNKKDVWDYDVNSSKNWALVNQYHSI